jgi:hypothetical protein
MGPVFGDKRTGKLSFGAEMAGLGLYPGLIGVIAGLIGVIAGLIGVIGG